MECLKIYKVCKHIEIDTSEMEWKKYAQKNFRFSCLNNIVYGLDNLRIYKTQKQKRKLMRTKHDRMVEKAKTRLSQRKPPHRSSSRLELETQKYP
jgi:hypothetical protein